MKTSKTINDIYFDEISDKIDGRFLVYLGFDNVDVDTYVKGKNLYFLIKYQGRLGRRINASDEHGVVSCIIDYSWTLKLVNPKIDMINSNYENVTLHIFKPFLFRGIKVTMKDSKDKTVLVFRAQKSILERVVVD